MTYVITTAYRSGDSSSDKASSSSPPVSSSAFIKLEVGVNNGLPSDPLPAPCMYTAVDKLT